MSSSFTQKILQANITLIDGTFGEGQGNQVQLHDLRMTCDIEKGGHPSKNKMKLIVYGMLEADMNKLTTIPARANKPLAVHKNLVTILAGDKNGLAVAFTGEITNAHASYQSPPNLEFKIEAIEGFYHALAPIGPTSVKGNASVASLMSKLAQQMGYDFQNNGVTGQLHNPYLAGPAFQQCSDIAAAANIEFGIDNNILFIAPRGGPRKGTVPLISKDTGLKEYPVFDKKGLKFECLYNSGIILGGSVVVKSDISVACGTWRVNGLKHKLAALMPSGHWHTSVSASYVGS